MREPLELVGAQMVSNRYTTDDVTAIIGVSGRLEGNVLYGFSEETSKPIITVMLGEDANMVDAHVGLSAIGEIANVITGNAATQLAAGLRLRYQPPGGHRARRHQVHDRGGQSDAGQFHQLPGQSDGANQPVRKT